MCALVRKVGGNWQNIASSTKFNETMAHQTDLLRAPSRKRKPDNMVARKPRIVKMTWDVDHASTEDLLDDLGVAKLEDTEEEDILPTPTIHIPQLAAPGAPRITILPILARGPNGAYINTLTTPLTYIEPQGIEEGKWLFRKPTYKTNDGTDYTSKLSDEIVLQIFRWLPKTVLSKCLRVCKRWHNLTLDETLWRRLDLANRTLKAGVIGNVLDRGTNILRLTRSDIKAPLYTNCDTPNQPRYSKLQYLDVSMATISTDGLEQLLQTCHMLRKLSLENCELTDNACRYIGQNRNIEVLNLSMCSGITENGLVPICNNLQKLDALNLAWTNMSRGAVVYAVTCLPLSLTKLNLSGCRETLLDEDIEQLCQSCPNLKELDLSDATQLTSLSVQFIATMMRGLEYVALSRCYHIIPSSLPLLMNILTLLALDVFGMLKDSALFQLREVMPSIEINKFPFSSIARPTTGIRRTSIWGLRVRDSIV